MLKKVLQLLVLFSTAAVFAGRTIYITRHGQIGDPKIKAFNGEHALTELGRQQAGQLGEYLKRKKFNGIIYSSPLYRTMQTSELVAKINNSTIMIDPGLQEYAPILPEHNNGKYGLCAEGCDQKEIRKYFPEVKLSARFTYPWRVMNEPEKMRHERIARTLDAVLAETSGDILLVGHSATVKSLMFVLSKRSAKTITAIPWNCCLVTVTLDDNNKVTGYTVETDRFLNPEQTTNNFRSALIRK